MHGGCSFILPRNRKAYPNVTSPVLYLAPMAGMTDSPFRLMCRKYGAEFCVSEMISAAAMHYRDTKTAAIADFSPDDTPIALQIFGHDPAMMTNAADMLLSGSFPGCTNETMPESIDINMGCPVKKITSNGDGSSLMRSPSLVRDIVLAVACVTEKYGVRTTVKIRSGWDASCVNAPEIAQICASAGASAITIHARTRDQMYAGNADYDVIKRVRDAVPENISVIGNGDVKDYNSAMKMVSECGVDGVMIGRAALGNPWIFDEIKCGIAGKIFTPPDESEKRLAAFSLAKQIVAIKGERAGIAECRGRCAYFIRSSANAAAVREKLNRATTLAQLYDILVNNRI